MQKMHKNVRRTTRLGRKLPKAPVQVLLFLLFVLLCFYALRYMALSSSLLLTNNDESLILSDGPPLRTRLSLESRTTFELMTSLHDPEKTNATMTTTITTIHSELEDNVSNSVVSVPTGITENESQGRAGGSSTKRIQKAMLSLEDRSDQSPYAYVFVIGGCDPARPSYRNYLYDVLNSAYLLRQHGSKADMVAFFQMSASTNLTGLPSNELRWLSDMNVKLKYIPKSKKETFYTLQLNKFRILGLTEYRRVIYMDADSMPTYNLDYLFELSDRGPHSLLQPNLILAGSMEPANGGFFMLEPIKSALKDVTRIIQAKVNHNEKRRKQGIQGRDAMFDPVFGWGHTILPPDYWESNSATSHNWTFLAPYSDQGLLYYYAKYIRQNTTMVLAGRAQHWKTNTTTGEPYLFEEMNHPFENYTDLVYDFAIKGIGCNRWTRGKGCPPPYSHFLHFSGLFKPWNVGVPSDLEKDGNSTPDRLWWSTLTLLNAKLGMDIDDQLNNWTKGMHSIIGHVPNIDHSRHLTVDLEME